MKIIRFIDDHGSVRWGVEREGGTVEAAVGGIETGFKSTGKIAKVSKLLAPIEPSNIFGIGLNYRRHAEETGKEPPERPVVFMKPTSAAIGPGDRIMIPACSIGGLEVDYECELAVVIGSRVKNAQPESALDCVLGYMCANDVSARRWQKQAGGGQWVRGKGFDTFCPIGPRLVTADEIGDPQSLTISTTLNGTKMQSSNTADMISSVAELISFVSQDTTLLPGTVILTGTPEGVGFARTPEVFLKPGDEVSVEVEKIGRLTNPVAAAQ